MRTLSEAIKKIATATTVLALCSCQRGVDGPVRISAPVNARDMHVSASADSSSQDITFTASSERDGYVTSDQIESQLTKAGYVRCNPDRGKWETVKIRREGQEREENRLLRFFKTKDPRQLGMIYAKQSCKENQPQCDHQFTVRQINVPKSVPDGDKYVQAICENRSEASDPNTPLKFP